jgi:hypothetical protein
MPIEQRAQFTTLVHRYSSVLNGVGRGMLVIFFNYRTSKLPPTTIQPVALLGS